MITLTAEQVSDTIAKGFVIFDTQIDRRNVETVAFNASSLTDFDTVMQRMANSRIIRLWVDIYGNRKDSHFVPATIEDVAAIKEAFRLRWGTSTAHGNYDGVS